MKRSLVAATAVALLLTGCATGETGHLHPDIDPDLATPRAASVTGTAGSADDAAGEGDQAGAGDTAGTGTDDEVDAASGVRAAFDDASGDEPWFVEVTAVDLDDDVVVVTTLLTEGGTDAVAVCEAALEAAQTAGLDAASVDVRGAGGVSVSGLDAAAGDEACSD